MDIEREQQKQALRELRSWCEKWDATIEALDSNCVITFIECNYILSRYVVNRFGGTNWSVHGLGGKEDLSFGPSQDESIDYRAKYEELLARVKELQKLIEDSGVVK